MSGDAKTDPVLRCGILGAARIAPRAVVEPSRATNAMTIVRIAARDPERARTFAAEHGIEHVSASYRDLIVADDIDVVYNPLPMSLHAEWTIAALRAGKHVLCEKPFASNATEAADMVRVAAEEDRILGEAFHYWHHPMFQRILALVRAGTIGTIERIEGAFAIKVAQPDIRWDYATSGGSTMDLGCYPIHWVRSVMGTEPTVVSATAEIGPDKIDASLTAELSFEGGATGTIHSAMNRDGKPTIKLEIVGSDGSITAVNPLGPQSGNKLIVTTAAGTTVGPVDAGTTFDHMVRAFADHVVHGAPYHTKGEDAIANMAVIDACYQAAGLPRRGA